MATPVFKKNPIYELMSDDEVLEALYDELPQDRESNYYKHEESGITFYVEEQHSDGPHFIGNEWGIDERPAPDPNIEMCLRDIVVDWAKDSETKAPKPAVKNPFIIEPNFSPLLGCGFGGVK